ncbi:hypothetical protein C8R44DRAFT_720097 [Mycena epipterygia]|nr:hypothetical protein C8R44DRAFT_720097 [Mycena epipterygia]
MMSASPPSSCFPTMKTEPQVATIWWPTLIGITTIHILAIWGAIYWRPINKVPALTLFLACLSWSSAGLGITIGYHRLYSHRSFKAKFLVRVVLAGLGAAAGQGSIKWCHRCIRHRLHHRYTDDPNHDPYAASRGLFYSHIGWLFYKPIYERIHLIDREDLESDPVVRFQHRYFVPLAFSLGLGLPAFLGLLWNDPSGAFVWAGLVARVAIWHATFLVNSLAHWHGLQPYSDEDTSRESIVLAFLTGGEGSHNFHAFPHDWRSGPHRWSWDPPKWTISILYRLGWVTGLRTVRTEDMKEALEYMDRKTTDGISPSAEDIPWGGDTWDTQQAYEHIASRSGSCVVLIDDYFVDVTAYMAEHPGGAAVLKRYSMRRQQDQVVVASWAFDGGLNNHSRSARRRMKEFRIARLQQALGVS